MNIQEKEKLEISFNNVKTDVINLQANINHILDRLKYLEDQNKQLHLLLNRNKPKNTTKTKNKTYVVSKAGKKLHVSNCLHAQNIKKENRKIFKNKTEALNRGYKLCSCLAY